MRRALHMPAEWAPHSRCWMGWPWRPDMWREGARTIKPVILEIINAISQFEPVSVVCRPEDEKEARSLLPRDTQLLVTAMNDIWLRDTGPTFLTPNRAAAAGNGTAHEAQHTTAPSSHAASTPAPSELAGVAWRFNGWGELAAGYQADTGVASAILHHVGAQEVASSLVLEGGSIHVDGEGTLLTTEECLLNANRNPGLSKAEVEQQLRHTLGATKVLWLPRGLHGDSDTSGHVDNMACFARPGVVLLAWTDGRGDPQYERSAEALEYLSGSTDAAGRPLQVVKLHVPPAQHRQAHEVAGLEVAPASGWPAGGMHESRLPGARLAASYVNFYLPNGGVVMPAFGCPAADKAAQQVLRQVFPGRRVVAVQAREVLLGGGNIHCITCQQPGHG